jgi:hypothetical protein
MQSEAAMQGIVAVERGTASRHRRRYGLVLTLAAVALMAALYGQSLHPVESTPASTRIGHSAGAGALARLRSLPLQAQSVISGALGSGQAAFAATADGGGFRLAGGGLRADLSDGALRVHAAGGSLSLALIGIGRGGRVGAIGSVSGSARANRVTYDARAGLREWYAAGPLGIEQGFALSRRPAGAHGPLTLELHMGGSLRAVLAGSQVRFLNASGRPSLRYGGLIATDADGRRLPAVLALRGRSLLLRITDRGAAYPLRIDPLVQQGEKLVGDCTVNCANEGTGETGSARFGLSVALSSDGNTALVGAPDDNDGAGAVWVFTRSEGTWTQQGEKLVGDCASSCANEGTGETGAGDFGGSVALAADGDTALIGGREDNGEAGAAWVFTRTGGAWTQQGEKLVGDCTSSCAHEGTGETGVGAFGYSVALSANGDTALIGGIFDVNNGDEGAVWVFTRTGGTWTQQGAKLVGDCTSSCAHEGTGEVGGGEFGYSVALSADGSTALIGAQYDSSAAGAAWVFTRTGGAWSQQGAKLVDDCTSSCANEGTGGVGGLFGFSVALSADGSTALIGAPDSTGAGMAWVFKRSGGAWTQVGAKLVGDCTAYCANEGTGEIGQGAFGSSVTLASNGNAALIGGEADNSSAGAAWLFTRSGGAWIQQGEKIVGNCTSSCANEGSGETGGDGGEFGYSVTLSSDGSTALIGGFADNSLTGAAWTFEVLAAPEISSVPSLDFGSLTTGQQGPVAWLEVASSGQAPLTFTGPAQISGADAGDFGIPYGDELCEGRALEPDQVCWIGIQFTPAANGPRSATLTFGANNTTAPAATVSLTGIGVAANSGPAGSNGTNGAQGPQGAQGPAGSQGPTGLQGPAGSQGPVGANGKVELVTCTTVTKQSKGKKKTAQKCTTRLVSGPVSFTTASTAVKATLSRHGHVAATGTVRTVDGHVEFIASGARVLPRGRYTLSIARRAGGHSTTTRQTITIE